MLSVIMLNVFMLSFIMLSVAALRSMVWYILCRNKLVRMTFFNCYFSRGI
jgi:hypothetical protein